MEITKNLILYSKTDQNEKIKNLVVLLSWVDAREKPVLKYVNYYLRRNSKVLVVKLSLMDGLWPSSGAQITAEKLVNYLDANINEIDKILLHGFSGGGYFWGETLLKLNDKQNCELIKTKVVGQIWDSVTPPEKVPAGVAFVFAPNNKFLKLCIIFSFWMYLIIFYVVTRRYHIKACDFFVKHPVKAPTLLFYSKTDELGAYENNLKFEVNLKKQNVEVEVQCWDNCRHIGHFVKYPQEYVAVWTKFLEKIKF